MRSAKLVLLGTLMVLFVTACTTQSQSKAPNFSLKSQEGKIIELNKLVGKVVVINFWATWCGPCRAEIPGMLEVYDQYRSKGLEIVGVSLDLGGWSQVRPFIERMKVKYPIVIGDGDLADAYGGIMALPTTFFVDRKGTIVGSHIGYLSKDKFEAQVKTLVNKK